MIRVILSLLNFIIPKRKIIIFNSYPDFSGNSLSVYLYILNNRQDIFSKYRMIWCVNDETRHDLVQILENRSNNRVHEVVKKNSIRGILLFLSAKYIFSTHGYFPGIKSRENQIHVNLWHGMPFKRIGKLLEGGRYKGKEDEADLTIATSDVFQSIMAKSFDINESNVLITGQPSNDFLYNSNKSLEKLNIKKEKYNKVLLWMPTYRKSVIGDIRNDGNHESFGILDVLGSNVDSFNSLLMKKEYLLLVKLHPMDSINNYEIKELDNILVLKDSFLLDKDVLLYELVGEVDVLLTDYSSIFIDYLVTKKPIAFLCSDLKEYSQTRGFSFDSPTDYLPGQLISNYGGLVEYINNIDEINYSWEHKRREVQSYLTKYTDNNNSQRVCEAIWPK